MSGFPYRKRPSKDRDWIEVALITRSKQDLTNRELRTAKDGEARGLASSDGHALSTLCRACASREGRCTRMRLVGPVNPALFAYDSAQDAHRVSSSFDCYLSIGDLCYRTTPSTCEARTCSTRTECMKIVFGHSTHVTEVDSPQSPLSGS